jgi:hypothetical protein
VPPAASDRGEIRTKDASPRCPKFPASRWEGLFPPRTPRAGQNRSAREPTGDFSLSLTRMGLPVLLQRKKKRLVNGWSNSVMSAGSVGCHGCHGRFTQVVFTAEPSALDAEIQRGTSPQNRGGPPHWASSGPVAHEQA